MSDRFCLRFLTLFAILFAFQVAAWSTAYYVRAGGSDSADGRSAQTAFRTLTRAAQCLNHGDRIVMGPGRYTEATLISERFGSTKTPLAILGDESGKLTGDAPGAVIIAPALFSEPALLIHRSQQVQIAGLTFRGLGVGLQVEKVRGITIARCTFDGLAKGAALTMCDDVNLESMVVTRCITGVLVKQCTRSRLAHLTVASCASDGLMISASPDGVIRNSLFANNGTAMIVDHTSASSWSSDYNALSGTVGPWGLAGKSSIIYEWFSSSGQERHSSYTLPTFTDPTAYDLHIAPQITWAGGLPGQAIGTLLTPPVTLDRDGSPFTLVAGHPGVGAYNYPTAQPAPGWKKLAIPLTGGPRMSAGIYTPDGTLVRMLLADEAMVNSLWWNGRDDAGVPAPAGKYEVRAITHDVRLVDDGSLGNNGSPLGTFNCASPERVVIFGDGSFAVTANYNEAGIPLRYYTRTGVSISGSALEDKDIWAIANAGNLNKRTLIAGVGRQLQSIVFPGERALMANGAKYYPILADDEKLLDKDGKTALRPAGLAVGGGKAYVTLPALNVVRVIDLTTGAKLADWPVDATVGDVGMAPDGAVWALAGAEVVVFDANGQIIKRYATGLPTPRYLAIGAGKVAISDPGAAKIAMLNLADGQLAQTLGQPHPANTWLPVAGDLFCGLNGLAVREDGVLIVCDSGRVRAIDPTTKKVLFSALSTFMNVAVPHPLDPSFVYSSNACIYRCDYQTGAWELLSNGPPAADDCTMGQASSATILGGKPYLLVHGQRALSPDKQGKPQHQSGYFLLDVTTPTAPRVTGFVPISMDYHDLRFAKNGDIVIDTDSYAVFKYRVYPFNRFDAQGNPLYDFTKPVIRDCGKDSSPVGVRTKFGLAVDPQTNDYYLMAVSKEHSKMVPAWESSGSGLAKIDADGKLKWFSLTSGGNFTGTAMVRDKQRAWAFISKDFGGQVDAYTGDGLRLATLAWSWPGNWTCGFVDMRDALTAFVRPDGKPGLYVEDDNIGRLMRGRLDGEETMKTISVPITWAFAADHPTPAPMPNETGGAGLLNPLSLPRMAPMPIDGNWSPWAAAGVTPQCVMLPIIGWGRTWPEDLLDSFRAGTGVAAFAHDGQNLYCYFLVTADKPIFGDNPAVMFAYDGIEFWVEEEQFGLGFVGNQQPALFKYRYHNKAGVEWAANYKMADELVWGKVLADVGAHPLGQYLGNVLGASLDGKPGYVLEARIPLEEIKLVGGIAGRKGRDILPNTAAEGQIMRMGVVISGMSAWGREQDYKVFWPLGLMFSDPTSLTPFAFGK